MGSRRYYSAQNLVPAAFLSRLSFSREMWYDGGQTEQKECDFIMKYKKAVIVSLYILLVLCCAGVVGIVGGLSGNYGWFFTKNKEQAIHQEEEERLLQEQQQEEQEQQEALEKQRQEQLQEEQERQRQEQLRQEEEERLAWKEARLAREKAERERDAWLEAYRKWQWENKNQLSESESGTEEPYCPPQLMIASDLHYMSGKTHDDGIAFQYMLSNDDGKLSQYSDAIVDALLAEAVETKPSALVLCGDNTLNGEYINHVELAGKLRQVQEAGIPVLIIPGNHDIQNENAAVYFEADREPAEYLHSAQEFLDIYHEFGYDQAISRDEASLSYVYALDDRHWMMMVDSCQYEDYNHVNGRIRPETLEWMKQCLEAAREQQAAVIPVAHHNLLSESRLYTTECTIENHLEVIGLLESYELPLYISGHLHAQRIKKHKSAPGVPEDAYGITEIVMSPYSIPPCQYGFLAWDEQDNMTFETRRAQTEGSPQTAEEQLFFEDFDHNAEAFTKALIREQVIKTIHSVPDELKEEMAELYAELYYNYCAGNRMSWDLVRTTRAYKLWQRVAPDSKYVAEMGQMIEDVKEDLHDWEYQGPGISPPAEADSVTVWPQG